MKKGRHYLEEEIGIISQSAIGKSFREIRDAEIVTLEDDKITKGSLGGIIEEALFGIEANGESEPDFIDAGIELKVTPYRRNKDNTLSAKERLVLNMIDYMTEYKNEFFSSGENNIPGSTSLPEFDSYQKWLKNTRLFEKQQTVPVEGFVPATQYLLRRKSDGRLIGMLSIRHELNDHLKNFGGNFGGSIRPSERNHGYSAKMLQLGIKKAKKLHHHTTASRPLQGRGRQKSPRHNAFAGCAGGVSHLRGGCLTPPWGRRPPGPCRRRWLRTWRSSSRSGRPGPWPWCPTRWDRRRCCGDPGCWCPRRAGRWGPPG